MKQLLLLLLFSSIVQLAGAQRIIGVVSSSVQTTVTPLMPTSVSGLTAWYRPENVTVVSGDVDVWLDQSGNGINATAPSSANRPTYGTNTLNGYSLLNFATGGKYMQFSTALLAGKKPTILIVARLSQNSASGVVWLGNSTSGVFWQTGAVAAYVQGGTSMSTATTTDNVYRVWSWRVEGTNTKTFGMGTTEYTRTETPTAIGTGTQTFRLFGYPTGSSWDLYTGDVAEVVIYDHAPTATELAGVELYLTNKYGL